VPAAAVIPAPIAYFKIAAVKTPVVEVWGAGASPSQGVYSRAGVLPSEWP